MQDAIKAPHVHFAVLGDRRNGVERLSLIGSLDVSSASVLEREVDDICHTGGAVVLDLYNLDRVDIDAAHALEAMARRVADGGCSLFIVHCPDPVRAVFERDGVGHLLSVDVSEALSSGDGDWSPISLPPLPGQRVDTARGRIVERQA